MENENGEIKKNLTYVDIYFFLIRVNLHLAPFAPFFSYHLRNSPCLFIYLFIVTRKKDVANLR